MIEDTRVTPQSINNTFENGLLTKPTPLHSMYMSGMGGFITGYKFIGDIYNKAAGLPENRQLKDTLELIEREKNVEGQSLGQRSLNWIADMVGYSISPPVLALGGLGGAAARGLSIGARAVAPAAAVPFLERQVGKGIIGGKPFTVGDIGERLAGGALAGELSMVPMAFEEGKARVANEGGALGFALSSVPILLGLRKGLKVKGAKVEEKPSIIPQEAKPEFTTEVTEPLSETDQWHHDYENKLDTKENLANRATKILQKEGIEVNPVTHEVNFQLLNENDVRNLQSAVTDSITSDVSQSNKNHLIDYIINNRIDEIRSNPKSQMMLRAYDNYLTGKLAVRQSIIVDADKFVSNVMKEKITNKAFLSQPEIEKAIKKLSREESHVSQLPFALPENIEKRIKLKDRIAELKKKEPVRAVVRRIKELENKIPKIMKPKEEVNYLYDKIIKGKEYHNKLKSRAYQRLQELADYWPQARALLERIHLEEELERQQAIKDALSKLRKEVEKPIDRSARPEDVITYLKERIEGIKPRKNPIGETPKTPEQVIQEVSKVPSDVETVLAEHEKLAEEAPKNAKELKKELVKDNDRIKQFKSSGKALGEFIQCVLGSK